MIPAINKTETFRQRRADMYLIFGDEGHCIRRIGWCNVKRPHFHSFDVCGQCGGAGARSEGAAGAGVARRPSAAVCAVRPRPVHAAAASRRRAARAPRTRHPRFTHTHPLIITTINPQNGMNIPSIARECECSRCLQYVVPPSHRLLHSALWRTITALFTSRSPAQARKLCMSCAACAFRNELVSIRVFVYLRRKRHASLFRIDTYCCYCSVSITRHLLEQQHKYNDCLQYLYIYYKSLS